MSKKMYVNLDLQGNLLINSGEVICDLVTADAIQVVEPSLARIKLWQTTADNIFSIYNDSGAWMVGPEVSPNRRITFADQICAYSSDVDDSPPFCSWGDFDTGMFFPVPNSVGFVSAGVELARINAAGVGAGVAPHSTLHSGGSFATALTTKTTTYTATGTDRVILGDATGGAFTVTLPTAVGVSGREYVVKKTDSGGNAVTVGTTSSQTIDGSTTKALATQYKFVTVVSDGANWHIISVN